MVGENAACIGTQRVLELDDMASAGNSRFIAVSRLVYTATVTR